MFGSMITAMVTPFDSDFGVNYDSLVELAGHLVKTGSDSLVATGTTGESTTLSKEEKIDIYKAVVGAVKGKAKVIAGTGVNSTRECIELSLKAQDAGVDGVMLVTPYYNRPPQEGLYQHFKSVADALSIPVMLYNVPGRTAVNLAAETTLRLAEVENIVAIKEASGNVEQITYICADTPDDFAVYSGDDSMTLPVLICGGNGVVSISAHLVGNEIKKMIDSFLVGNVQEAVRLHQKLMPLFKGLFMSTNPIPLKAALSMTGINVGQPRLPLTPLPESQVPELRKLLHSYDLIS